MEEWKEESAQNVPNDELISKKAAIEDAREAFKRSLTMAIRVMDLIKSMLSVEPEQRWIPVSERMPENDNEVLITVWDAEDDYADVYKGFYQDHEWWTQWCHGCLKIKDEPCGENIVIAWMPLPAPYRKEGEEG